MMVPSVYKSIVFEACEKISFKEWQAPTIGDTELLIKTKYSGISSGTERLVLMGGVDCREGSEEFHQYSFPLSYGYINVGSIIEIGSKVSNYSLGQLVFTFSPHQEIVAVNASQVIPIPQKIDPKLAVLFPNMETVVGIAMDSQPLLGETVTILGGGILGQLLAQLLSQYPGIDLHAVEPEIYRLRQFPAECTKHRSITTLPKEQNILIELTGNSAILPQLFKYCTIGGRIVIGSWYGDIGTPLHLVSEFHHRRIQLISSQVSNISQIKAPHLTRNKRYDLTWKLLGAITPNYLLTHPFPFKKAQEAYQLLLSKQKEYFQIYFEYESKE